MSLPSGLVEFGTQSLADEIRQALEEEGLVIFFLIWLNEC